MNRCYDCGAPVPAAEVLCPPCDRAWKQAVQDQRRDFDLDDETEEEIEQ